MTEQEERRTTCTRCREPLRWDARRGEWVHVTATWHRHDPKPAQEDSEK